MDEELRSMSTPVVDQVKHDFRPGPHCVAHIYTIARTEWKLCRRHGRVKKKG